MSQNPGDPYRSARDLPSVAEMIATLEGLEALTLVVAEHLGPEIQEIRKQIEEHVEAVDAFYDILGTRHWILHESLDMDLVRKVGSLSPEAAECRLIERYQDPAALDSMIRRIRSHRAMRARSHMLERPKTDFLESRHYSTALLLLAVMDGFVNDLDLQQRRGLHTRAPDEIVAWDSIADTTWASRMRTRPS
jgi:quinol monooxygenase YgiN